MCGFFKSASKPQKKKSFFSMDREEEKDKTFEVANNNLDSLEKQKLEDDKKAREFGVK